MYYLNLNEKVTLLENVITDSYPSFSAHPLLPRQKKEHVSQDKSLSVGVDSGKSEWQERRLQMDTGQIGPAATAGSHCFPPLLPAVVRQGLTAAMVWRLGWRRDRKNSSRETSRETVTTLLALLNPLNP